MKPLEEFACINPECRNYGKKGLGNIIVHQTYGKRGEIRLLQCKTCGKRFSERANTPLYNCRLPQEKALSVLHHLAEGCSQRKTARLVGVNKETVRRLSKVAGEHSQKIHDEYVRNLEVEEAQADEKWSFVGKFLVKERKRILLL